MRYVSDDFSVIMLKESKLKRIFFQHYGQFDPEWQYTKNKLADKLTFLDKKDFTYVSKALITDVSEWNNKVGFKVAVSQTQRCLIELVITFSFPPFIV